MTWHPIRTGNLFQKSKQLPIAKTVQHIAILVGWKSSYVNFQNSHNKFFYQFDYYEIYLSLFVILTFEMNATKIANWFQLTNCIKCLAWKIIFVKNSIQKKTYCKLRSVLRDSADRTSCNYKMHAFVELVPNDCLSEWK